jgi:hypothetical protein
MKEIIAKEEGLADLKVRGTSGRDEAGKWRNAWRS